MTCSPQPNTAKQKRITVRDFTKRRTKQQQFGTEGTKLIEANEDIQFSSYGAGYDDLDELAYILLF
jgi:hypothetical protein